jgi:hypothetical protein
MSLDTNARAAAKAAIEAALRALAAAKACLDAETPAAPDTIVITTDTVAQHLPSATPRWFADACRRGAWPSFRLGRKRAARLADVLAAIEARPAGRSTRAAETRPANDQTSGDDRLRAELATAGVTLRRGAR